MDKLLSYTNFQICMAALKSREIPSGHGKATAIRITQVTALTRSRCILQYGGLFGSIRWRPEKGGHRLNKVTAYSGSTVYTENV